LLTRGLRGGEEKAQAECVEDFFGAVVAFLAFRPSHAALGDRLARAVTDPATPVGSGPVYYLATARFLFRGLRR
jgi:hypothetical protein